MAKIPDVPQFSLSQVLTEVSVVAPDPLTLLAAINAAVPSYFDSRYNTGTIDRLSNFQNYPVIPLQANILDFLKPNQSSLYNLDVMSNDSLGTQPTDIIAVNWGSGSGSIGSLALAGDALSINFTRNGTWSNTLQEFTYTIQDSTSATSTSGLCKLRQARYLVSILGASNNGSDTMATGTYTTGINFQFTIPDGASQAVNACVIFDSLSYQAPLSWTYNDSITC
tara:strand:- start:102 stop:773 length:672 start_codon:yes stop_codon:yes gene_type:complete